MGRLVLRSGGGRRAAQQGFTLIEVMTAMVITITVMLANLYLFDTARKNLAQSRALTAATNLATNKIAELKAKDIAAIVSGTEITPADDIPFTSTWVVSDVDLDHDGNPEMVDIVVKIKLDVRWTLAGKDHHLTLATFATGKDE